MATGASINRHRSFQSYATPGDFRTAVINRFGFPAYDLAADASNYFGPTGKYFMQEQNSLIKNWGEVIGDGYGWLNPPFGNIEPWAKKCSEEVPTGAKILLLVPASVGSFWFQHFVFNRARVLFLNPRLCFDGKAPFPKDCILACYNFPGEWFQCWRWKA